MTPLRENCSNGFSLVIILAPVREPPTQVGCEAVAGPEESHKDNQRAGGGISYSQRLRELSLCSLKKTPERSHCGLPVFVGIL